MEAKTFLDIPYPYSKLFDSFETFNPMQTALFDVLLHGDKSVVLSAPTGSGKTTAFEWAMVRMLMLQLDVPPKAVYVAPLKSLCAEKFHKWSRYCNEMGLRCVQITGDSQLDDFQAIHMSQLIVTTPEKWELMSRAGLSGERAQTLGDVRLFMIDEVHLLNEDVRGPILEVIVARQKYLCSRIAATTRFIVASATIPNTEDLLAWLGGPTNAVQLIYSEQTRPVPLQMHVVGFNSKLEGFKFDISLNYKLADVVLKYSARKATMIFCSSRKSAEMAAQVLVKVPQLLTLSTHQQEELLQLTNRLSEDKLKPFVQCGIAYHHAGLIQKDRNLIEESFRNGFLMILLCTNTLAMGVNLPTYLVIVKSTESYILGSLQEYPESTLQQMIGRAGRPPYDNAGVSVIMTHTKHVNKYKNLMNTKIPIESHLHKHLIEHINSEITLETINNLKTAMDWLCLSYLYVRCGKNPANYGLKQKTISVLIDKHLEELCLKQIKELRSAGFIANDSHDGINFHATEYGKIMAKYCISLETMQLFRSLRGTESFIDIFNLIVRCKEFGDFLLRVNEKKQLNELNKLIRYPIHSRIKTREEKISCLLQAVFGQFEISSPGLLQESAKMLRIGERISKCLADYVRVTENQVNSCSSNFNFRSYKAILHTVTISKCFHAKLWENSEYLSKQQLRKIDDVYATSSELVNAGKSTLKSISERAQSAVAQRTTDMIEINQSAAVTFGNEVTLGTTVCAFPEYSIELSTVAEEAFDKLRIYVKQLNKNWITDGSASSLLLVGDSTNNLLICKDNIDNILCEFGYYDQTIELLNKNVEIHAHILHNNLGVDKHVLITVGNVQDVDESTLTPLSPNQTLDKTALKTTINTINISKTFTNLQQFCYSKPPTLSPTHQNVTTIKSVAHNNSCPIIEMDINSNVPCAFAAYKRKQLQQMTPVQTKLTSYFAKRKKQLSINNDSTINYREILQINSENENQIQLLMNNDSMINYHNELQTNSHNINHNQHDLTYQSISDLADITISHMELPLFDACIPDAFDTIKNQTINDFSSEHSIPLDLTVSKPKLTVGRVLTNSNKSSQCNKKLFINDAAVANSAMAQSKPLQTATINTIPTKMQSKQSSVFMQSNVFHENRMRGKSSKKKSLSFDEYFENFLKTNYETMEKDTAKSTTTLSDYWFNDRTNIFQNNSENDVSSDITTLSIRNNEKCFKDINEDKCLQNKTINIKEYNAKQNNAKLHKVAAFNPFRLHIKTKPSTKLSSINDASATQINNLQFKPKSITKTPDIGQPMVSQLNNQVMHHVLGQKCMVSVEQTDASDSLDLTQTLGDGINNDENPILTLDEYKLLFK